MESSRNVAHTKPHSLAQVVAPPQFQVPPQFKGCEGHVRWGGTDSLGLSSSSPTANRSGGGGSWPNYWASEVQFPHRLPGEDNSVRAREGCRSTCAGTSPTPVPGTRRAGSERPLPLPAALWESETVLQERGCFKWPSKRRRVSTGSDQEGGRVSRRGNEHTLNLLEWKGQVRKKPGR